MLRSLVFGTMLLTMLAAQAAVAAEDDADLAALMDETAVALARIDVTNDEPGATFAALAFGGPLSSQSTDMANVFRKLLTAAGVRHVVLILQVPTRLSTGSQPFAMDAVCVIPFDTDEAAVTFAKLPGLPTKRDGRRIATRGRYCLVGATDLVESALAGNHPPRASIASALAAAGDAPLAIVVAPSADQREVFAALLPTFPATQGGDLLKAWAREAEWTTLAYDPQRSLRLILQAKSTESAVSLADSLDALLRGAVGKIAAINDVPVQTGPLLAALAKTVDGQQVSFSVDIGRLPPGSNAFTQATESAMAAVNRQQAMQHFKLIGVAMQNHHDAMKRFPDAAWGADGKPLLSWRVRLLPFLGESALYKQFHLDEPWDSEHNRKLIERMPDVYRLSGKTAPGKTCIQLPIGADTAWPEGRGRPIREFTDGTSKTILIVETDEEHAVPWTQPADLDYDPTNPTAGLGGHFGKGFVSGSADSAARYLPLDIKPETLRALFTAAGKEPVSFP